MAEHYGDVFGPANNLTQSQVNFYQPQQPQINFFQPQHPLTNFYQPQRPQINFYKLTHKKNQPQK
jgi:hypothetical protein